MPVLVCVQKKIILISFLVLCEEDSGVRASVVDFLVLKKIFPSYKK